MSTTLAQRGRRRRGAALAQVAQGQLGVRETVMDGHKALGTCPIHRILQAAPGMGPKKTRKTLEQAGIWPLLTLGELTDFQRISVLDNLPDNIV